MNCDRFTIRQACRADAHTIHELHTASATTLCVTHYPLEAIQGWLARRTPEGYYPGIDAGEMFVCEAGGKIVGFGHAVPGEVLAVFVHPQWTRQGVGSLLLQQALERATCGYPGPVKLQATLNAQPFYEQHGFVERRRRTVQRGGVDLPVVEMEGSPDVTEGRSAAAGKGHRSCL
jgi:GNAT superfamily N-acetyltransferase